MLENQEPTTVQDNDTNDDSLEGLIEGGENLFNEDGSIKQNTIVQETNEETSTESNDSKEVEPTETTSSTKDDKGTDGTTDKEETDNKPFLKIKYNKEDKELSQEEAVTLAQKGMNYDHLQTKVDELSKVNDRLKEQAKANGMTIDEYLDSLDKIQQGFEYDKALKEAKEKYPDADESLLKELVDNKIAANRKEKELSKVNEKTKDAEERQAELQKQIDKFLSIHKDIKVDNLKDILTDEMYALMDEGYTLSEAYDVIKNNEDVNSNSVAKTQAKVDQKKADNKSKSIGNVSNSGSDGKDILVEAFMSAFK